MLNSSFSFGQAAPTFSLPATTTCLSKMSFCFKKIDFPGPLLSGQVSLKHYFPSLLNLLVLENQAGFFSHPDIYYVS